jgi:hypothetical protein
MPSSVKVLPSWDTLMPFPNPLELWRGEGVELKYQTRILAAFGSEVYLSGVEARELDAKPGLVEAPRRRIGPHRHPT